MALREYREAVRINHDFAPAATAVGWILVEKGKVDEALDYFSTAIKADPNDAHATFGVGRVYDLKRMPELAGDHYERAFQLEKDPSKKTAILNFIDKIVGGYHD
jgi:tetratricopeptide (TPR) repeat protein